MHQRQTDPRRLDVAAVATAGMQLGGRWPLAGFARLVDGPGQDGEVPWSVRGERRGVPGGEPEIWLHLNAHAHLWRDCQRCLQPVALDLVVARALRFVADEATAEALDAETEDDVLAMPRSLDLHALVEDELLLALPLVPMHVRCPVTPSMSAGFGPELATDSAAPKPFAVLARMKQRPG